MFKLGQFINNLSQKLKTDTLLSNPINVSLLVVVVIFVILYFICYDDIETKYDDINMKTIIIKSMFFSFLGVMSILFMAHSNLENIYKDRYSTKGGSDIVKMTQHDLIETVSPI